MIHKVIASVGGITILKSSFTALCTIALLTVANASYGTVIIPGPPDGSAGNVLGELWQNISTANNASILPPGSPDAQFYTTAINYNSNVGGYTPSGFLNNPTFFNTSAGFDPNASFNNTFIRFTGSTYLNDGINSFSIPHDDGLTLDMGGVTVLSQPGPTAPVSTPFDVQVSTAGYYSFDLQYAECCGAPAVLGFQINGAPVGNTPVPEPATIALFTIGLLGLGISHRYKATVTERAL